MNSTCAPRFMPLFKSPAKNSDLASPHSTEQAPQTGATGFAPDEPTPGTGPAVAVPDVAVPDVAVPDVAAPDVAVPARRSVSAALSQRLQRVTHSTRYIPEVDGLRFVAIFSVIMFHLSGQMLVKAGAEIPAATRNGLFVSFLQTGGIGVQLFFALSGFILSLPFARYYLAGAKPIALRGYYLRRVTRIEPPYLISLFLFFILLIVVKGSSFFSLLPHLAASIFYVHNLVYGTGSAINFVAWSLEIEVQFYLIAPFIALLFKVRSPLARRALWIALIAVFALAQPALTSHLSIASITMLGQAQYLLVGFLLSDLYMTEWIHPTTRAQLRLWDALALLIWPFFMVILLSPAIPRWILPFVIFFMYASTLRGKWARYIASRSPVTLIGGMCYSIYLLHFQIIAAVWPFTSKIKWGSNFAINFAIQLLFTVPAILLVSTLFYVVIERPFMSRNWLTRVRARLAAT